MRTEPSPPVNAIAAGAAAAAAAERGASDEDQFKQALAAGLIAGAAEQKQADTLEAKREAERAPRSAEAPHHREPSAQPREGFLRKLAHWLNLM